MKVLLKIALLLGAIALVPFYAQAQEAITAETTEINGGFLLTSGSTKSAAYTVGAPGKFILNLSFSGTGTRSALQRITYGIQTASNYFEGIVGSKNSSSGYGFIENALVDGPFSIVYAMSGGSSAISNVTFYGTVNAVPEIGAKGAVSAIILLIGSVAVITGRRKREGEGLPLAA